MTALRRIETAISGLVSEEDAQARQRQEGREIADLKAQWEMTDWAEWMFYAALATVLLTAFGVVLIWRTLHHTRRAADAAYSAVKEARGIGEAQTRAYVQIINATAQLIHETDKSKLVPGFIVELANSGNSPARGCHIAVKGAFLHERGKCDLRGVGGPAYWAGDVPSGRSARAQFKDSGVVFDDLDIDALHREGVSLVCTFYVSFYDVFEQSITLEDHYEVALNSEDGWSEQAMQRSPVSAAMESEDAIAFYGGSTEPD